MNLQSSDLPHYNKLQRKCDCGTLSNQHDFNCKSLSKKGIWYGVKLWILQHFSKT